VSRKITCNHYMGGFIAELNSMKLESHFFCQICKGV